MSVSKIMERRPILIYGNCQGEVVGRIFATLAANGLIDQSYEVSYIRHYNDPELTRTHLNPEVVRRAAVVLLQVNELGKETLDRSLLSADAKVIPFPYFHCASFWPLVTSDKRNVPIPNCPNGKYPEGDRLVLKLLKKGLTPEQTFIEYMKTDLNSVVDLDRLRKIELQGFRRLDEITAVPITDFFLKNHQSQHLFWSTSHPSKSFFEYLCNRLLAYCADAGVATYTEFTLEDDPIDLPHHTHVPLHPQVIEHYGLKYLDLNTKYRHFQFGWYTFCEYLYNYIRFV